MEYMSAKEAAQRWGISERRVRALCEAGKIEGVTHVGQWVWSIPENTQKPADGRTLRYAKNRNLRTGSQNYAEVDKIRQNAKNTVLTESIKAKIIEQSFQYDGKDLNAKQVSSVLNLKPVDVEFKQAVEILNMKSLLSNLPLETSETGVCNMNRRLLQGIDEKSSGEVANGRAEFTALFKQYSGDWSILHPVARASFLFTEILRIEPFAKLNTQTAFAVLANEMIKAKLPPVIFDDEATGQLKAALASAKLRGNTQQLVTMIIQAITK